MNRFYSIILFLFSVVAVNAQLIGSHMVLQRNQPLPIGGVTEAGKDVTVTFRGKTYHATADAAGKWCVTLPKQKAGGPYTMTIDGKEYEDILVGDVWLVSGQSNIDVHIERVYPKYAAEVDAYSNDKIRLFQVKTNPQREKATKLLDGCKWVTCNKNNAWHFSSLGYFLAKQKYEETGVPQGMIQSSLGGSPIQSWVDIDSIKAYGTRCAPGLNPNPTTLYKNYLLYTDPQYVAAMSKANKRGEDVWFKTLDDTDPGIKDNYTSAQYDDSAWPVYSQYDNSKWARTNGSSLGSIWLRQHVVLDKDPVGEATLLLGTFHDMDYTYVNGKQVGVTYYQYPPRRYKVPAGLLHKGDNVITIRLICKSGMANFYKDKPHEIVFADGTTVPTSFDWKIKTGSVMPEGPLSGKVNTNNQASMLYNGMIAPLGNYPLSGIVWYQGESNAGQKDYDEYLRMLMSGWRQQWGREDIPFTIVQLANYMEPTTTPQESGWAYTREQQRLIAKNDANAQLAVNIDLGEASDIHPLTKKEIAGRVSMAFNGKVSPEPLEAVKTDNKIVVTFDQQLETVDNVCEVEVRGIDGKYRNAQASAKGRTLTITMPNEPATLPLLDDAHFAVRYAWKNNPAKVNLYDQKHELPVSPFQITVE